ncbi:hypothetical protein CLOSTMETH_02399 [[Clostridium] methylpentosum DSM 5476]|uniref:DUF6774 domain-containing protein n=1 Tax=[Clostridium] methylpentosum DSM 5476 TaxID=537013 RepID=C0EEW0_9FIRM|nr:hypothetical protein CLOSTMETH_02399 [[Clostridium] methylpentosum DSM 5476]MDY3988334.1 DUF6774 domain-containing protein [Massilioclostridium sp.]MEE1491550.1 DUF6774 domain-containing protein [Massilioclostridium sp.]
MNECELTASITALAVTLAQKLDADQLALIAAAAAQLGDTLETILVQREICQRKKDEK